jgi:lysophospholipase L1-like esterase
MPDSRTPPHQVDWEPPSEWRARSHPELAAPPDGRLRARWTHVLALGIGAFALWFVLFAPTLQHDAQVSPVGVRRTASLDITGPVAAISRGLQLSHFVSITGRTDRLPGGTVGLAGSGISVAGSDPGSTTHAGSHASSSSVPTTVPPNPKLPTAATPLRLLIVGDSIGLDVGGPLQSDLAGTGVVNAALDARESTGLTRPDYFNWPAELEGDLRSFEPQVVVVMIGANDPQDFLGPPDVPYASPQWNTLYAQRVAQFMQIADSGGAAVVWVGMPPMQDASLNAQMQDLNAVVQHQAGLAHPPVTYVSTDKALGTPQGGYTAFVTDGSGQVVNVRAPDGTHLTTGGGQLVAQQVIARLQAMGYHLP